MAQPRSFANVLATDPQLGIFLALLDHVRPGLVATMDGMSQIRTLLVPSNQAFLDLAANLGLVGTDPGDAAQHLIASLTPQQLTDMVEISLVRQAFAMADPPKVPTGLGGQTVLVKSQSFIDGDADTPDAMIRDGNREIDPIGSLSRHMHVLDTVLLPFELPGNDGTVTAMRATTGADTLIGDDLSQSIDLLGGDDFFQGGGGDDLVFGSFGDDRLVGGHGNDQLVGARGEDFLSGGWGNDILRGGGGQDRLNGNQDDDFIKGGGANDYLSGGDGNDIVDGGNGNDRVHGGDGDDRLYGDDGQDRVVDGRGNSTINGGRGDDFMKGGPGADTFVFDLDSGHDHINDFQDGVDVLDLTAYGLSGIGDLVFTQIDTLVHLAITQTDSITFKNALVVEFDAADFLF